MVFDGDSDLGAVACAYADASQELMKNSGIIAVRTGENAFVIK
jgi:hypothetical protein